MPEHVRGAVSDASRRPILHIRPPVILGEGKERFLRRPTFKSIRSRVVGP